MANLFSDYGVGSTPLNYSVPTTPVGAFSNQPDYGNQDPAPAPTSLPPLAGANPLANFNFPMANPPGSQPTYSGINPSQTYFQNAPQAQPAYSNLSDLRNALAQLINQAGGQAQYGQQQMLNVMNPMSQLAGQQTGQFQDALGMTQGMMSQLPYSLNWAGGAATNDYNQQLQTIQQLLGQTLPTTSALQGNVGQGLSQQAMDMVNAIGGRITNPLQQLMTQGTASTGLVPRAEDMLNAIGGMIQPSMQTLLGNVNQGLDPATLAAMRSQATDQTSQQYQNAKQGLMTQLMQQGAMGTGEGAGTAQMVGALGGLETARQQQQSTLMQNIQLANQQALQQNRQMALSTAGLGGQLAQGFTGLEQQAAQAGQGLGLNAAQTMGSYMVPLGNLLQQALTQNNQLGLGASQLTGNLTSELGNLYQQGALGFTGQVGNMYNLGMQYPLPYMQGAQGTLQDLLQGAQGLGNMGLAGVGAAAPFTSTEAYRENPGSGSSILGSAITAGASLLGTLLG